jgi:hypothetical protein
VAAFGEAWPLRFLRRAEFLAFIADFLSAGRDEDEHNAVDKACLKNVKLKKERKRSEAWI